MVGESVATTNGLMGRVGAGVGVGVGVVEGVGTGVGVGADAGVGTGKRHAKKQELLPGSAQRARRKRVKSRAEDGRTMC
jgi:hypothetical protein